MHKLTLFAPKKMREPLLRHATVLNEVARHEDRYSDWWAVVLPYKAALLDAIREELKWPDDANAKPTEILGAYTSWLRQFEGTESKGSFQGPTA